MSALFHSYLCGRIATEWLINMELKDTVAMMLSPDYKERFKAEYFQLCNRIGKLCAMLAKWRGATLDFVPSNSYELLDAQISAMVAYQRILEIRAEKEGIELALAAAE